MTWLQTNWPLLLVLALFSYLFLWDRLEARWVGVEQISVHDLAAKLAGDAPPLLVDVRSPREFNAGHVRQALLVPLSDLRQRAEALLQKNPGRDVAVICQSGNRSLKGSIILKRHAETIRVYNVAGGTSTWRSQGFPVGQ
ncbi:MAG: rhodanese-like domain-containing protein [Magnetococcales bacterium]|nr:rhodanese-like domain-containing protein [Magnetococcales bacterium]MBF0322848.1 rhodanese-like domain-containing protein [Magnetococcales bacterium]